MPFAKDSELARLALVAVQYREQVGEALRARRTELGLTQPQVADRVEDYLREHDKREDGKPFDAQNISRWERGKNLATTDNLEAVAHALETTPGELLARVHASEKPKTPDLMGQVSSTDTEAELRAEVQDLKDMLNDIATAIEGLSTQIEATSEQSAARFESLRAELAKRSRRAA